MVAQESPENQKRFDDVLRESVADVVKMQAKVGIDIVNDGEFGKSSWANYILERTTGFEHRPEDVRPIEWLGRDIDRFPEVMAAEFPTMAKGLPTEACVGPIKYGDHSSINRDIRNLKDALKSVTVEEAFLPVVAPASAVFNGINEYYPTEKDYVYAVAEALREEYRAIYESGVIVQVDDAVLANMYDHYVQQSPEKYRQWAGLRVEALNHALQGIPEDRVRYHVCFGSWHVPHLADAPLEEIVGFIVSVRAGAYSIEAANPRHEHEWRVWEGKKLPAGENPDSRRCHPPHTHRRASAPGRRPHRAICTHCWTRERNRRHRLWLRPGSVYRARCHVCHVGEIRGAGRGRANRQFGALAEARKRLGFESKIPGGGRLENCNQVGRDFARCNRATLFGTDLPAASRAVRPRVSDNDHQYLFGWPRRSRPLDREVLKRRKVRRKHRSNETRATDFGKPLRQYRRLSRFMCPIPFPRKSDSWV